jgi:pimeloyl-ACP methyl ester carboxylesterase
MSRRLLASAVAMPADVDRAVPPFLLVETNNTGALDDDLTPHREAALKMARGRSVGGFVAKHLNVALLVPIFPRPKSEPHRYTHALDRDTMRVRRGPSKRLDRQLLAMIDDARRELEARGIVVGEKVLLNGFSASGTFANRFAFLHPERVRAVAYGGINGVLMLPHASLEGHALPYPLGIQDLPRIAGAPFAADLWRTLPQLAYMGADDSNDAVAFDDAYSSEERRVIHKLLGEKMQPDRWQQVQSVYRAAGANVQFRTYAGIGHGTNGAINREVAEFFRTAISSSGP